MNTHIGDRSGGRVDDFNIGLYHRTVVQGNWEWKNYLGTGYQRYRMWRSPELGLVHLPWSEQYQLFVPNREISHGTFNSRFNGYSMALSTEIARPFLYGENDRFLLRPFMAIDVNGFWQGSASECPYSYAGTHNVGVMMPNGNGGLEPVLQERAIGRFLALDYHRTNDIRVYWRPGVHWETAGPRGNLRANVAYSFRAGGRGYTSVKNQFQYGGGTFNQRGVQDGIGFVTVNIGTSRFLDRKRTSLATFDYWVFSGAKSTTQALQLGAQKQF